MIKYIDLCTALNFTIERSPIGLFIHLLEFLILFDFDKYPVVFDMQNRTVDPDLFEKVLDEFSHSRKKLPKIAIYFGQNYQILSSKELSQPALNSAIMKKLKQAAGSFLFKLKSGSIQIQNDPYNFFVID